MLCRLSTCRQSVFTAGGPAARVVADRTAAVLRQSSPAQTQCLRSCRTGEPWSSDCIPGAGVVQPIRGRRQDRMMAKQCVDHCLPLSCCDTVMALPREVLCSVVACLAAALAGIAGKR